MMRSKIKRNDFIFLKTEGIKIKGRYFILLYQKDEECRWAVVASKRVGNAVERNYAKRSVREMMKIINDQKKILAAFLIICLPFKQEVSFEAKKLDLFSLIQRIKKAV